VAALLPRFHPLAVLLPEVRRQLAHAAVQQLGVLEHLVVEVVLGGKADRVRLDAHVDVFRHQHDFALRILLLEVHRDAEDHVVGLLRGDRLGDLDIHGVRLQEERAAGFLAALGLQQETLLDVAALGDDLVQEAARLARVPRDLAHALLVVVELLERHHRQEHVVLLESEEARRIVHEHVRVQHE